MCIRDRVWVASGHVGGFSDPLMDCRDCKTRHRADKLIEDQTGVSPEGWDFGRMQEFVKEHAVKCPECGSQNFTDIRSFNLMFKTFQGVTLSLIHILLGAGFHIVPQGQGGVNHGFLLGGKAVSYTHLARRYKVFGDVSGHVCAGTVHFCGVFP